MPPNHKQKLTLMNRALSKRTKDFIEWELRDISGSSLKKPKKLRPAAINDVIPEEEEEYESTIKASRGPRKPHEIVDKDFVHWSDNQQMVYQENN